MNGLDLLRNNSLERVDLDLPIFPSFNTHTHAHAIRFQMNEYIESHFQKDMLYSNLLLIGCITYLDIIKFTFDTRYSYANVTLNISRVKLL